MAANIGDVAEKIDQQSNNVAKVTEMLKTIEIGGDWGEPLGKLEALSDVPEWKLAVVLAVDHERRRISLSMESASDGTAEDIAQVQRAAPSPARASSSARRFERFVST